MVHGVAMKCMKYLLFAVNFIFVLAGLLLVVFGGIVLTRLKLDFLKLFMTSSFNGVAIALIIAGVLIVLVAFLGCCGALRENHCMVVTYAVLLTTILILQVAVAIAGLVMSARIEDVTGRVMEETIKDFKASPNDTSPVTIAWNDMQKSMQCCGAQNYTDWKRNDGYKGNNTDLPDSCCTNESRNCGKSLQTKPTQIHPKSCSRSLISYLKKNLAIVIAVAGVVALVELMGIFFAFCLARRIGSEYNKVDE